MATHPDFPNLEVTTVPTPEKFYQPQSGDGIILIAKKAYPGMNATDGAHIISNSSYNRKHHGYAMGGSYNCKSKVNAQTPNALIVLCAKPWPLVWIPQLASRAEPESYGSVFVPGSTGTGTGQEATPGGGAATMTTKKPWTTWQKVGLGLVVASALAVGYIFYSGKRGRRPVQLPAHG